MPKIKEIIELKRKPPKQVKRLDNRPFFNALNRWLELQRKIKFDKFCGKR